MMSTTACNRAGFLALLLWSTSIGVTRAASEVMGGPFTSGAVTFTLGGLFMLAVEALRRGPANLFRGFTWRMLLLCGGCFVAYQLCYVVGFGIAPSRELVIQLGLVNYLWPLFTILFSLAFFVCHVRWPYLIAGSLTALAGVSVAVLPELNPDRFLESVAAHWTVFLIVFGAAVTWGLYCNVCRKYSPPEAGNGIPLFQIAGGLCFLLLLPVFPEESHWERLLSWQVLYLALLPVALAYFLWEVAVRGGNLILLSAVSYFAPLASTLFCCWLLQEPLRWGLLAGCGLVILGALLSHWGVREKRIELPVPAEALAA